LLATFASTASGRVIELGQTRTPLAAPKCPTGVSGNACTIVLTRVTGLASVSDGIRYPTTVSQAGRIVAFTVGLSRLSSSRATAKHDIHLLDAAYGGTTQAAITILKPVGAASQHRYKVVAEGPVVHLQPYLGQVVQFPLSTSIPVSRNEVVALSVPTWAPILAINLSPSKFAYRQSRSSKCNSPGSMEFAQLTIGSSARYQCSYTGTRIEYSATEITNPVAPSDQIRSADSPR
jgi:hypothetical protein